MTVWAAGWPWRGSGLEILKGWVGLHGDNCAGLRVRLSPHGRVMQGGKWAQGHQTF